MRVQVKGKGIAMFTKVLTGIVFYGLMALFLFWLARMSIRHEISKHPDPSYHVALAFIKAVSIIVAVAYVLMVIVGIVVLHVP